MSRQFKPSRTTIAEVDDSIRGWFEMSGLDTDDDTMYSLVQTLDRRYPVEFLMGRIAFIRAQETPDLLGSAGSGKRRGGLTRDQIVEAVIATREPDGSWGTQPAAAEYLKLEDPRRIRQVQGARGWNGVLEDAEARLRNS